MIKTIQDVIIIGAGASGLMCAIKLGEKGVKALVLEGQGRPARKLLMTGGGRCNITNAVVKENDYGTQCHRIVRHVLRTFSPKDVVFFFEHRGIDLVLEEDGKYFTADGRASKVVDVLVNVAEAVGAKILCGHRVESVSFFDGCFILKAAGQEFRARNIVVTTGGLSYPETGSNGAGFAIAKGFGHKIITTIPALVPLLTDDKTYSTLSGLTLSAGLSLWSSGRKMSVYEGSFLFTHVGFSGPVVMDMSRDFQKAPADKRLAADFAPVIPEGEIEARLMDHTSRLGVIARLGEMIPKRLAGFLALRAKVDTEGPANLLKRGERQYLLSLIKEHPLPISGTAGFHKAEATSGGVDLNELQGASLESKLQPGLFFAGEVLDVDGRVGGFNLQWAWASGVAAAQGILRRNKW
ncbi:MAG: NAD(P)/FAD-dependent oxidoreductase [Candidatus Omnitrophica bacterium]|nr:NAD(P)/FAD-dependent oxidoreductase [Candidatus Omnitrophota bacterium]